MWHVTAHVSGLLLFCIWKQYFFLLLCAESHGVTDVVMAYWLKYTCTSMWLRNLEQTVESGNYEDSDFRTK